MTKEDILKRIERLCQKKISDFQYKEKWKKLQLICRYRYKNVLVIKKLIYQPNRHSIIDSEYSIYYIDLDKQYRFAVGNNIEALYKLIDSKYKDVNQLRDIKEQADVMEKLNRFLDLEEV